MKENSKGAIFIDRLPAVVKGRFPYLILFVVIAVSLPHYTHLFPSRLLQKPVALPHMYAVNILESTPYIHHPVLAKIPQDPILFRKDFLAEPNGLYVPTFFDCSNIHNGQNWGSQPYYKSVPSRWTACQQHMSEMQAGLPWTIPKLPVIDEEYFETIAVYDAVLNARNEFVIAELGARWGTWGARAVAFLKHVNNIPYRILFVEPLKIHCEGLRQVMKENNIEYELQCERASSDNFVKWAQKVPHVDVLDVDIQGAEMNLFGDNKVMNLLKKKVRRVILGTHNMDIHNVMRKRFRDWHVHIDTPFSKNTTCVARNLRSRSKVDRAVFERLVELGCYRNSSYGKIANWDGELIMDNPYFYNRKTLFPSESQFHDKE